MQGREAFLDYLRTARGIAPQTSEMYISHVQRFAAYMQVDDVYALAQTTTADLLQYQLELLRGGEASATIAHKFTALRHLFRFLRFGGLMNHDPCETIKSYVPRKPKKVASRFVMQGIIQRNEEVKETVGTESRSRLVLRDRALVEMIYDAGLQVNEVIALNLEDFLPDCGLLYCGRLRREVRLSDDLTVLMKDYVRDARPLFPQRDETALFLNYRGTRMTRQGLWKIIKQWTANGVRKGLTPRILRNSNAAKPKSRKK